MISTEFVEQTKSMERSRDETAPALTPDKLSMEFHKGAVVWARCGPTFPFWPSCIIPNELLPAEVRQPLFSSPFDDAGEGMMSEALKRKIPVFYFGRSDFDLIRPKDIKPFHANFELYREQRMNSDMVTMFELAVAHAQDMVVASVEQRLEAVRLRHFRPQTDPSDSDESPSLPIDDTSVPAQSSIPASLIFDQNEPSMRSFSPVEDTVRKEDLPASLFFSPAHQDAQQLQEYPIHTLPNNDSDSTSALFASSVPPVMSESTTSLHSTSDTTKSVTVDANFSDIALSEDGSVAPNNQETAIPVNGNLTTATLPSQKVFDASSHVEKTVDSLPENYSPQTQPLETVEPNNLNSVPEFQRPDFTTHAFFDVSIVNSRDAPVANIEEGVEVSHPFAFSDYGTISEPESLITSTEVEKTGDSTFEDIDISLKSESRTLVPPVGTAAAVFDFAVPVPSAAAEAFTVFAHAIDSKSDGEISNVSIVPNQEVEKAPIVSSASDIFATSATEKLSTNVIVKKVVAKRVDVTATASLFGAEDNSNTSNNLADFSTSSAMDSFAVAQASTVESKPAVVIGSTEAESAVVTPRDEPVSSTTISKPEHTVIEPPTTAKTSVSVSAVPVTTTGVKKIVKAVRVSSDSAPNLFGGSSVGGSDLFGPSTGGSLPSTPQSVPVPVVVKAKVKVTVNSANTSASSAPVVSPLNTTPLDSTMDAASVFDVARDTSASNSSIVSGTSKVNSLSATTNAACMGSFSAADVFASAPMLPQSSLPLMPHGNTGYSNSQAPVSATGARKAGATVSAADFFSAAPPPAVQQPSAGPPLPFAVSAPPSAPGVRSSVTSAPPSVTSLPMVGGLDAVPGASPGLNKKSVVTPVKHPSAHNSAANHMRHLPPNAIPTPHGFAFAPANTSASDTFNTLPNTPDSAIGADGTTNFNSSSGTTASATSSGMKGGRKIHKPVGALCAFGFGGVCLVSFPPQHAVPPVLQSVGNRFDSPLHRLPLLGARPGPLIIRRLHSITCNKSAIVYGTEENKGEEEVQRWLGLLRSWQGGDLCPASNTGTRDRALASATSFMQQQVQFAAKKDSESATFLCRVLEAMLLSLTNHNSDGSSLLERLLSVFSDQPQQTAELFGSSLTSLKSNTQTQDLLEIRNNVQKLLVSGRREEALEKAMEGEDYTLALLVASVCGQSRYQDTVRQVAQRQFAPTSALHSFALLCCDQTDTAPIFTVPAEKPAAFKYQPNNNSGGEDPNSAQKKVLCRDWRQNVALLLANKSRDWQLLLLRLARRLSDELQDPLLAQATLLAADLLPCPTSFGKEEDTFVREHSLLMRSGGSVSVLADVNSLTALRASEVYEAVLFHRCQQRSPNNSSNKKGNAGGGLLGWFSGSANQNNTSAKATNNQHKQQQQKEKEQEEAAELSWQQYRAFLCPLQLRLAIILADMGLIGEARSYVSLVSAVAQQLERLYQQLQVTQPPPSSNSSASPSHDYHKIKLSKKFLQALEDFDERLSGHFSTATPAASMNSTNTYGKEQFFSSSSSSSSSKQPSSWGTSFSFSVSLKDLVDGPAQQQPGGATSASAGNNNQPAPVTFVPNIPQPPMNLQPSISVNEAQVPPIAISSVVPPSFAVYNQQISNNPPFHKAPPTSTTPKAANTGGPPLPGGRSASFYSGQATNSSTSVNSIESSYAPQQPYSTAFASADSAALPPSAGHSSYISNNSIVPPTSVSSSSPDMSSKVANNSVPNPASTVTHSAAAVNVATNGGNNNTNNSSGDDLSAPTTGFMGSLRKGIIKWILPNAVDATENTGSKLEAYFDKQLNRWVFPGEEDAQAVQPLPPPPTGNLGMSGGSSPMIPNTTSAPSTDPLAALMAPPSRSLPGVAYGSNFDNNNGGDSNDPLAMMMRPPPLRSMSTQSMGSSSNFGTTPSSTTTTALVMPPKVNVWKPPSVTINNQATIPAAVNIMDTTSSEVVNSGENTHAANDLGFPLSQHPSTSDLSAQHSPPQQVQQYREYHQYQSQMPQETSNPPSGLSGGHGYYSEQQQLQEGFYATGQQNYSDASIQQQFHQLQQQNHHHHDTFSDVSEINSSSSLPPPPPPQNPYNMNTTYQQQMYDNENF